MAAKKPAPKKPVAKSTKPAAKKAAPKKVAPAKKAAPAKKPVAKKPAAKKAAPAKKAVAKKVVKKAAPAKKVVAKKAVAKKVVKKVVKAVKKVAPKKAAPAKKVVVKKAAPAKKVVAKKAAPAKKAVAPKPAPKTAAKPTPKVDPKAAAKPAVKIEADADVTAEAPKPRGRKQPLNPEDIPDPTPLLHQPEIEIPKARAQKDTRPKDKKREVEDESMWTGAELKAMKARFEKELVERQAKLVDDEAILEEIIRFTDAGAGSETADTGNSTLEREFQISLVEKSQANVEQTLQALSRLEAKTFGLCNNCGKPIGKLRLQEANPYAILCIECKEAADKGLI